MKQYTKRIKKLEASSIENYTDVLRLINQGKHYDELTDSEKERYCQYHGTDRKTLEECSIAMYSFLIDGERIRTEDDIKEDALHFKLERMLPPPTPEELSKRIQEVSEYLEQC